MIVTTTESILGKEITEILGIVRGNTVRSRHLGKDIIAGLRSIVGGEILEYTKLLSDAREQATDRLIAEATELRADAVVGLRFTIAEVMQGSAEILAFGTAVKLK